MDNNKYDSLFKFIMIGNSFSGKSCVLYNFLHGSFKTNSNYTVGVEFSSKQLKIQDKIVKLQIWDTAGQERFKAVARTYYRGAIGAVIVFDLTNAESFQAIPQWISDAKEYARNDVSIVICANKSDLVENRVVSEQEIDKLCKQYNVKCFETSALDGKNINMAFEQLSKTILEQIQNGHIDQSDLQPKLQTSKKLGQSGENQKKGGSCFGCGGGNQ
ncbi:P-loop containing nucleoside triphosphate hydrolase [Pseudocohnilembus persalinus]|uniref:p-loop containing nucleoside triphosphate hydrolase n=1 Tax=Pseudocohnilembus persalinus TaxID=266149 RepID=A0A0V0QAE0_PSEPJ|nr:P-loop containing nucleoside triphosphate hydrolase [Pseudocohnilembus persalinus]|eukprot:KRW99114.1 P-loop containing nucleoside triphosphate hydrolase [Pseudocohnilembus persalinus]